jgi:hypothetical protein
MATKKRYRRIPGTDLAIIERVPRSPRPPRQEVVVHTPRLPKPTPRHEIVLSTSHLPSFHITETSYHTSNPSAEIKLGFLTALFNFLASAKR